jgi:phosphosulfolactate synthase
VSVCLGGTLLEVAAAQGRLDEFRRWATEIGVDSVEVSNGLQALSPARKVELVRTLAADFVVFAEAGVKDGHAPVVAESWLAEMEADLAAGADWVIAEGRESGTVGLYHDDGRVRDELVYSIAARIPVERVIFEAPKKAQQTWFVRRFGADVNLGNVPLDEALPLETLRLGLRADTAVVSAAVAP